MKKTTIGIDARFYGPVGKGLGRYTKEVLDRLLEIDQADNYFVFLGPSNFDSFKSSNPRVKKILVKAGWYTLAEQLILPWLIWRHGIKLFHSPHFNAPIFAPAKLVVTIHDLILLNFSTERSTTLSLFKYKLKYLAYKLVIALAIKRAARIIAVSEFTRQDILKNFKLKPEKIAVTLEGITNLSVGQETDTSFMKKLGIEKPFMLYIGNAYPHKNLEGLLSAYDTLKNEQGLPQLVLVGRSDYFYQRLEKQAIELKLWQPDMPGTPVIFAGYLTDGEIAILYREAFFYIFPSLYEGFGLPPLEAMANGLPVLSSNQGSLPEILGEAAAYFNPYDQGQFMEAIKLMIKDQDKKEELRQAGFKWIKKYDWQKCAEQTLSTYHQALNEKL